MTNTSNNELTNSIQGYREPEFLDITFLKIESYSEHEEVYKAADILVEEFSKTRSQVRHKEKYPRDARKLIASIWFHEGLFRFTTMKSYFSKGKRKQVWMTNRTLDLFNCAKELGWIEVIHGAIPPYLAKGSKGMAAIYIAKDTFKALLTTLSGKDITNNPDIPCVIRKDKDKRIVEETPEFYESYKYKRLKRLLTNHLKRLQAHKASWDSGKPISSVDMLLTLQFTEDYSHGGRFYCNFQNKPKALRNNITIDGKAVGSLDITQCHPMLILRIYHGREREDGLFSQFNEDVYQVTGYEYLDRNLRKKIINTLFNANTIDAGIKSIMNTRWWIDGFTNGIEIKTFEKKQKRFGEKVFENKLEAMRFLKSFNFQHPLFVESLGSGIGLILQGFDGDITHNMLKLADELDIPMIPIHEEYLCKEEDKLKIIELLRGAIKVTLQNYLDTGAVNAKWTDSSGNEERIVIIL
jgi:hypothetical protein